MENNRKAYVYVITNLVNGKVYVGKTVNPENRWYVHKYSAQGNSKVKTHYITAAMKKYGISQFTFKVIGEYETEEIAYTQEAFYILYYKSNEIMNGYNLNSGGRKGCIPTDRTREKMRQSGLGRKQSLETREKRRQSLLGHKVSAETRHRQRISHLGHTPTEETRLKLRNRTRYPVTEITRNKLRVASTGRTHSEETKQKLRAQNLTESAQNKRRAIHVGRKHTETSKLKMRIRASERPSISEDTRRKISLAGKGRKHTEEAKAKIRATHLNLARIRKHLEVLKLIGEKPVLYEQLKLR